MSRIGSREIIIPAGVTVEENENLLTVKGPKGELSMKLDSNFKYNVSDNKITLEKVGNAVNADMLHGTMNANLSNLVKGVSEGFSKGLEIIGVGYKFGVSGNKLTINAGYSHPVIMDIPNGIKVEAISNTEINLTSADKVLLGEFAANVRKVRQPEPYKGKGIRYKDEHIRRKEGKKASK